MTRQTGANAARLRGPCIIRCAGGPDRDAFQIGTHCYIFSHTRENREFHAFFRARAHTRKKYYYRHVLECVTEKIRKAGGPEGKND
jgi:hypothetical protein